MNHAYVVLAIYYFAWFSPHANECANSVTAFEVESQIAAQVASNCNAEAAELYIATKIFEIETREAKARAEVSKTVLERLNTIE